MKITYKDWSSRKSVEVTGTENLVYRYLDPWDHRGALETTEHRVEKLQELVTRLIEVTAEKLQLDAVDLSKIFEAHILAVEYD